MDLIRASLVGVLTFAAITVQADFDQQFYKKRTMGIDWKVGYGLGPTPLISTSQLAHRGF